MIKVIDNDIDRDSDSDISKSVMSLEKTKALMKGLEVPGGGDYSDYLSIRIDATDSSDIRSPEN